MGVLNLIKKEGRTLTPPFAVFAASVAALHGFIRYKGTGWDADAVLILSLLLPILFAGCLAAGLAYYQLHSEWKANAIYLLLSLPIRGWKVLSAKLAAVMSMFLLSLLWVGASFALILASRGWETLNATTEMPELLPVLFRFALNALWIYGLIMLFVLSILQFSFLCGQLVTRLRWLVVVAAFFACGWLVLRISPVLSRALEWTPIMFVNGGDSDAVYLHSGPFLVLLFISAGFVWLSGYLLEKEVEV